MDDRVLVISEDGNSVVVNETSAEVHVIESAPLVLVDSGLLGPPGPAGPQGPAGPPGNGGGGTSTDPIVDWFTGEGPPPAVIAGAGSGDMYVDKLTGTIYQLQ